MRTIIQFISVNSFILLGALIGAILGYIYWHFWSCHWGAYPYSSEMWVNCTYGAITVGFLASLLKGRIN